VGVQRGRRLQRGARARVRGGRGRARRSGRPRARPGGRPRGRRGAVPRRGGAAGAPRAPGLRVGAVERRAVPGRLPVGGGRRGLRVDGPAGAPRAPPVRLSEPDRCEWAGHCGDGRAGRADVALRRLLGRRREQAGQLAHAVLRELGESQGSQFKWEVTASRRGSVCGAVAVFEGLWWKSRV